MIKDREATDTLLPAALAGLGALLVSLLVGVALSPVRDTVGLENVAIIYMAVVAVAAIAGGTAGGLMAALGGALSYNFFFTTPYRTLRIDSWEQIGTVALLFIAGALISFAATATRGRLFENDVSALPTPRNSDVVHLAEAVAGAKANGGDPAWVAVQGLRRLYDAQWVALIPSDDTSDRAVVWAGDPPRDEVIVAHDASRHEPARHPHQSATGAMAHLYIDKRFPAVLVVMPRSGQPLTERMQAAVLAVARALEDGQLRPLMTADDH